MCSQDCTNDGKCIPRDGVDCHYRRSEPCPTPEADTLVDVGVRLLGAIERLVEKLDALADAQFDEYE